MYTVIGVPLCALLQLVTVGVQGSGALVWDCLCEGTVLILCLLVGCMALYKFT